MSDHTMLAGSSLMIIAAVFVATGGLTRSTNSPGFMVGLRQHRAAVVVATTAAALAMFTSGWLVTSLIVGLGAGWIAATVIADRRRQVDLRRIAALATWIENLRDVLLAGEQPLGAISSTARNAPADIRADVRRLATGLAHLPVEVATRRFADDLDDPIGDLVAAGLTVAIRRGGRSSQVLSSLAEQCRHLVERRRLVLAERAPVRREVDLVIALMSALLAGLLAFGRSSYLQAYATASGQLVLGAGLMVFILLVIRIRRLAAFPQPARFFRSETT